MDEASKQKDEMLPGRDKRAPDTPALPLNGIFFYPPSALNRKGSRHVNGAFSAAGLEFDFTRSCGSAGKKKKKQNRKKKTALGCTHLRKMKS